MFARNTQSGKVFQFILGLVTPILVTVFYLAIGSSAYAQKPLVVTSIRPLALVVNDLAGDLVNTDILIENSASPHDFSLTISQAMRLSDADLLVWVGPDFEAFLSNDFRAKNSLPMIETLEGEYKEGIHTHEKDLHIWLSHKKVMVFSDELAQQLKRLLPEQSESIDKRLQAFKNELIIRNDTIIALLQPYRLMPFAVHHDGYSEFVTEYKLNQLTTLTRVPQERISAKRLNQIGQSITSARCLLTEKAEFHEAKRYANLFEKRLIDIDLLATDSSVLSYGDYLEAIAKSFVECLSTE